MTNEAIDVGDLVRIEEDIDTGDDQGIIYAQDIQAVGRVESIDSLATVFVAFPRGSFGFMANEVYLVDTDALHAEAADAEQPAAAPTVDSEAKTGAVFEHSNRTQAETELQKIVDREAEQKLAASVAFEALHETGAERFGMRWLSCNSMLANLRDLPYLPYPDRRIDALLSECAWKIAEQTQDAAPLPAATVARIDALQARIAELEAKNERLAAAVVVIQHYTEELPASVTIAKIRRVTVEALQVAADK